MPHTHRLRLLSLGLVATALLAAPAPEAPAGLPPRDSEGWIDLLAGAGPGLKGWTRVPIPPTGKLNPESQWSLDPKSGTLTCGGDKGHEWVRWDHELGDFVYRVDWRFVPVEGKARYNSGIYARNSADGTIWHQAQTGGGSGGYLFGQTPVAGKMERVNLSNQVRGKPVKPAGSWNTFEITCRGKTMTLRVNGEVTNTWDDCEVPRGYVGLEAEGYKIEFRNVKLRPL